MTEQKKDTVLSNVRHTHLLEDGTEITHTHEHTHTHTHQNTKAVVNRLSRAIGHLTMVKRMVEEGRDCSDVLIQLAAVKSALNSTGKVILKDHLEHCMVDAIESGDMKEIEELNRAIDQFIK
ncbi:MULTISPECIES: metal-sensing transcriptional repressor [unclassified Bilifractor]|uniref:metal-sensing transcriptional repressor n=1 Tax=unclassified Bilifractor TaxID=2815795 RepID=UPI003F0F2A50